MKNARSSNTKQNKQVQGHRPTPDVRDDLDSRKNEEQNTKGGDVTHNKKEVQNERKKKSGD
jgi:hypothetical protein